MTRSEYNLIRWYVRKRLSPSIKAKLAGHSMTEDDLVQECALWILKYPSPEPVKRTTGICNACRWAIGNLTQFFNRRMRNRGVFEPLAPAFLSELVEAKPASEFVEEAAELVERYLPQLSNRRQDVLKRCFGIGRREQGPTEIGHEQGVTKQAIQQQRDAALADLRDRIA